ncbi:DUF4404 family protein [Entomomonas moraniae]|uniref:DUF4404 family protein n=1 Tax=Entomomonas moraniae TaxID=2213226 RepID=A0A3Q9JKL5_9GAMM|nr:DUF4404 family protein [Entomomonas moraniae]AZS49678.1 DUF4404 family protein [Entomomonas moraniae]
MSKTVHENLIDLQYQLKHARNNKEADKAHIEALADTIHNQLKLDEIAHEPDMSMVEELGLAVGEFEQDHPRLAATLKSILLTFHNIGI